MVLECCLAAGADFLVTGDKDLLEIDPVRVESMLPKLRILTPRAYLEHEEEEDFSEH